MKYWILVAAGKRREGKELGMGFMGFMGRPPNERDWLGAWGAA